MSDPVEVEPLIVLSEVCGTSVTAMRNLITSPRLDDAILESCFKTVPYYPYKDAPMFWRAWLSRGDSGATMIKRWVTANPSIAPKVANESMTQHFLLLPTTKGVGWADLDKWMAERDLSMTDLTMVNAGNFSIQVGTITTEVDFAAFVKCIANLKEKISLTNTNASLNLLSAAFRGSSNPDFNQEELMPFLKDMIVFLCANSLAGLLLEFFKKLLPPSQDKKGNLYRGAWLGRAVYAEPETIRHANPPYRSVFHSKEELLCIQEWRDSLLSDSSSWPKRNSFRYLEPWMENCLKSLDTNLYNDFIHIFPKDGDALDATWRRDVPSWTYFYVRCAPSALAPRFRFDDVSNWMTWANGGLEQRVTQAALDALVRRFEEIKDEPIEPDRYDYTDAMLAVFDYGFKKKGDPDFLKAIRAVMQAVEFSFNTNELNEDNPAKATLPKLVWDSFLPVKQGGTGFIGDYYRCLYFALYERLNETTINSKDPANMQLAREYLNFLSNKNEPAYDIYRIKIALERFGAGIAPNDLLEKVTAALKVEKPPEKKKEDGEEEQQIPGYITAMEEVIAMLKPAADAP